MSALLEHFQGISLDLRTNVSIFFFFFGLFNNFFFFFLGEIRFYYNILVEINYQIAMNLLIEFKHIFCLFKIIVEMSYQLQRPQKGLLTNNIRILGMLAPGTSRIGYNRLISI